MLSIGRIDAAGATNVIPDEVRLEGTLRTFDEADRTAVHSRIAELASGIDSRHGVHTEVDISHGYPAVVNDPELTRLAVARAAAMGLRTEMLPLRTTAEDFGFYSQRYPALFYRLGVGRAAGRPHTALFAPDERALDAGAEFMRTLALQILDKQ